MKYHKEMCFQNDLSLLRLPHIRKLYVTIASITYFYGFSQLRSVVHATISHITCYIFYEIHHQFRIILSTLSICNKTAV